MILLICPFSIGSETENTGNNYAVLISAGGFDMGDFIDNSPILLNKSINTGFYTEIKTMGAKFYDSDTYVTSEDIHNSIDWLYDKSLTGDSTLLFYYVGHGTEEYITTDDYTDNISHTKLKEWFEKFDTSDNLVIIIDSCHSGNLTKNKIYDRPANIIKTRIINLFSNIFTKTNHIIKNKLNICGKASQLNQDNSDSTTDFFLSSLVKPGRIVISSCKKGESMWVYENNISPFAQLYSAFTQIFCEELENTDYIELAFNNAAPKVTKQVFKEHLRSQHPQMIDNIDGDVKII